MTRGRPTDIVAVLDNEAAQALADPAHPQHRRLLAVLEAVAQRRARAATSAKVVVSTVARLEAGLDRRAPTALDRLRVHDEPLTSERTDRAVALRAACGGAVADAATAQLAEEAAASATVTVYTADLTDLPALVAHLGTAGSGSSGYSEQRPHRLGGRQLTPGRSGLGEVRIVADPVGLVGADLVHAHQPAVSVVDLATDDGDACVVVERGDPPDSKQVRHAHAHRVLQVGEHPLAVRAHVGNSSQEDRVRIGDSDPAASLLPAGDDRRRGAGVLRCQRQDPSDLDRGIVLGLRDDLTARREHHDRMPPSAA